MDEFRNLPLDVRLSAYLDGQLEADDARAVEAELAGNAEARALLEQLKAGSAFGNDVFAEMLKEPVPLSLVRALKTTSPSSSSSSSGGGLPLRAANGNVVSFLRFVPQAIAASAVLLLAGGYTGYYVGAQKAGPATEITETSAFEAPADGELKTRDIGKLTFDASATSEPATRSLAPLSVALTEIAGLHKVYSADRKPADEIPASQQAELVNYLETVTAIDFKVPDLSGEGFTLRGGRLAVALGQPTGALFYENADGAVAAVYLMKNADVSGEAPQQSGFALVGGRKDAASYVIAAPSAGLARRFEAAVQESL